MTVVMTTARKAPSLPRYQAGNHPQQVLAALIADFSFANAGPITSSSVIELLAIFGFTEAAARSALSRVVGRGLLLQHREGRRVTYTVNPDGLRARNERLRHYVSSGVHDTHWDGYWTIAVFSVPDVDRSLRARLRTALDRLHLAPLTDAVWVHSADLVDEAIAAADDLGVSLTAFRSPAYVADNASLEPMRAFDLGSIRALYDEFCVEFSPLAQQLEAETLSGHDALRGRISCLNRWRRIVGLDPDLPLELLPTGWPKQPAYELFLNTWGGLGPLALGAVREVVSRDEPQTAQRLEDFR